MQNDKLIHEEKSQIAKNVPYRLLSPFIGIGGNDPLWDKKTDLIRYINSELNGKAFYTIGSERGLNKQVRINPVWKDFISANMVAIRGWIQTKKIDYLQARNPGVPGIVYKLKKENEKQRKLQNARKLWCAVLDLTEVKDLYSGTILNSDRFVIDHFIPWSYIANDELWNLIPTDGGQNSSKNNKLPAWKEYFPGFAHNQFILNQTVYRYTKIRDLFDDCSRDNLNDLWSTTQLYLRERDEKRFRKTLEEKLKPIYDSAFYQGFVVWNH